MNEPKRLIEGGGDRLGVAALRAARRDGPPAGSKQRALAALGVAGAATVAGSVGKAAVVPFALGPWALSALGVGVVSAGVAISVALSSPAPGIASPPTAPPPSAALAPPGAPRAAVAEAPTHAPPPEASSAPPAEVAPIPTPATAAPASPRVAPTSSEARRATLADEVAALDAARAALASRDGAGALRALDRYAADFPRGFLGQEATVLRVEALAARGDRAAAADLARRFVAAHPSSPMADRVRSLGGLPVDDAPTR